MIERVEMRRWIKALEVSEPGVFVWKIYDDPAGIKPFDVLVIRPCELDHECLHGADAYAYEFKVWRKKRHEPDRDEALGLLTRHQGFFLKKFKQAGGASKVVVFCQYFGKTLEFDV